MNITNAPLLASSVFLLFSVTAVLLIQSAGFFLDTQLIAASIPIAFAASFSLTYFYFFVPNRTYLLHFIGIITFLSILGIISTGLYDMTSDGLGYQQPSAVAILNGWNPLKTTDMLWQNIYPTATWQLGATLGVLFGSIEAAKMYTVLWLFIAYPILLAGLRQLFNTQLCWQQHALATLIIFCPVVFSQMFTHYVDAALYLSGITFLGAIFLLSEVRKQTTLAFSIMVCCTIFMVNAKLSGIYHAATLCFCAVAYLTLQHEKLPVREAFVLFCGGLVAVLFVGFHPYITNFIHYGSLLPMYSGGSFSADQRPANMAEMNNLVSFFYSIFSATGGAPKEPALIKLPWLISAREWFSAGVPDNRSGGFGVWFALGIIATVAYVLTNLRNLKRTNKQLLILSAILLTSSLVFPQNWWVRYVPFAYAAVLLLVLAIPLSGSNTQKLALTIVMSIFAVNSAVSFISALQYQYNTQRDFVTLASTLPNNGEVYLLPPGEDYMIYNHAHIPLMRRLEALGIKSSVKVNAQCPNLAGSLSEFKICYTPRE